MDIKTMLLMLMAGNLLITLLLSAYVKDIHDRAIQYHLKGQLLLTLSYPLMLMRDFFPLLLSAVGSAAAFIFGSFFEVMAVYTYLNIASPRLKRLQGFFCTGTALLFAVSALVGADTDFRVILISAFGALQLAYPALMLLKTWNGSRLQAVIGILHLLMISAFLARIFNALDPQPMTTVYEASVGQVLTFGALYAYMLVCGYGLILLFKEREDQLLFSAATRDSLTGILNRSRFIEEAERIIGYCTRKSVPYALLMIDLDHFKDVNDKYGHDQGDEVLKAFTATAEQLLRSYDLFGRFGGEEFTVLLQSVDAAGALEIAERIRQAVEAGCAGDVRFTISIGAAHVTPGPEPEDFYRLYHLSDNALYEAKKLGRNRVVLSDENPQER